MKSRTLAWITTITLLVGLAIPVGMATQGQNQQHNDYVIVDLGTLGGTFGEANAVSNKGSVAGDATLFGDTVRHAFLWRKGLTRDLDTLGGLNSRATSLNEEDEVTGISDIYSRPARRRLLWFRYQPCMSSVYLAKRHDGSPSYPWRK